MHSRREFLIGTGAVLGTALPRVEVIAMLTADVALLAALTPKQRRIVLSVLDNYPALPVAKAIDTLQAAGMQARARRQEFTRRGKFTYLAR